MEELSKKEREWIRQWYRVIFWYRLKPWENGTHTCIIFRTNEEKEAFAEANEIDPQSIEPFLLVERQPRIMCMLNINKVIVFSSDFVDLIKKGVDRANDDPKWKGKGFGLKRKDVELIMLEEEIEK